MRYVILVKATKDFEAGIDLDEKTLSEMANYTEKLVQAGALLGCERLQPSSTGTRVRCTNGKLSVIDGPFAETKELVAGICLIQANSKEEAIAWAKRIPLQEGEVEVRPLFEKPCVPADSAEKVARPTRKPGTIRYMALAKADRDTEAGVRPGEKVQAAIGAFMEEAIKAGVKISGDGLQASSTGARVRFSGSERIMIDGPFAETKELVAGYAILQFCSKAEAIEWTKRFVQIDAPGRHGGEAECEIRPLFEFANLAPSQAVERFREMGVGKME
jgi:hypothetical protein